MFVDPVLLVFAIAMLMFAVLALVFMRPAIHIVPARVEMSDEDIAELARQVRSPNTCLLVYNVMREDDRHTIYYAYHRSGPELRPGDEVSASLVGRMLRDVPLSTLGERF